MEFTIKLDIEREYPEKELKTMNTEELAAIVMESLEVGFNKNKIQMYGITSIEKESEE